MITSLALYQCFNVKLIISTACKGHPTKLHRRDGQQIIQGAFQMYKYFFSNASAFLVGFLLVNIEKTNLICKYIQFNLYIIIF